MQTALAISMRKTTLENCTADSQFTRNTMEGSCEPEDVSVYARRFKAIELATGPAHFPPHVGTLRLANASFYNCMLNTENPNI